MVVIRSSSVGGSTGLGRFIPVHRVGALEKRWPEPGIQGDARGRARELHERVAGTEAVATHIDHAREPLGMSLGVAHELPHALDRRGDQSLVAVLGHSLRCSHTV